MLFHIHECYPSHCGAKEGIQVTNDKNVTCPECLLNMTVGAVAKKLKIHVELDYNLRTPRGEMRKVASRRGRLRGDAWTLFINRKGNKCYAVRSSGHLVVLDESPEHLHDLKHREHAANYFINLMHRVMKDFHQ